MQIFPWLTAFEGDCMQKCAISDMNKPYRSHFLNQAQLCKFTIGLEPQLEIYEMVKDQGNSINYIYEVSFTCDV